MCYFELTHAGHFGAGVIHQCAALGGLLLNGGVCVCVRVCACVCMYVFMLCLVLYIPRADARVPFWCWRHPPARGARRSSAEWRPCRCAPRAVRRADCRRIPRAALSPKSDIIIYFRGKENESKGGSNYACHLKAPIDIFWRAYTITRVEKKGLCASMKKRRRVK